MAAAPTVLAMGQTYRGHHRADCVQSRVRQILGGSPTGLAESSSLSLRTGHSSQVALHLVSRQRSYHFRLQAGNGSLDGTFTRQFKRLHRRTRVRCADQDSLRSAQRDPTQKKKLLLIRSLGELQRWIFPYNDSPTPSNQDSTDSEARRTPRCP